MNHDSEALENKQQRLNEIINKVGLHMHERKTRQILAHETQKVMNEINFIEHKIAKVSKLLRHTESLLKDLEPSTIESKGKLAGILQEKTTAEAELARLINIENEMEARLAMFPNLKSDVANTRAAVYESTNVLEALKSGYLEEVEKKNTNQQASEEIKDKINKLSMEIQTINTTKNMIAGIMPEGFDIDDIDQFADDIEANIQSYTDEIKAEIEKVNRQTSDLKLQINNEKELEGSLLSLETELQRKIGGIKAGLGEQVDKPAIVAQVDQLYEQKEKLDNDFARNSQDMNRLEAQSKTVIESSENQQQLKNDLDQKLAELVSIEQKMDVAGDVEAEIHRLKSETHRNNMETSVNNSLLVTITDINNDIESINEQLRSVDRKYRRQLDEFYGLTNGLLA